jgi:phosphoribosylaminoimidazolecarboxamide formyltransferase/IMP cyclohydrolase
MERALISVYDKTGIIDFAKELSRRRIEIIATDGTLKFLKKNGIQFVKHVSDVTKFPEILDGRVKTGHPVILGGILALINKKEHVIELKRLGIKPIDLVVCNPCPIKKLDGARDLRTALENIDIGGLNLIRAAAKNFMNVVVIVNPEKYDEVLREFEKKGDISFETRYRLALEAVKETVRYDCMIYKLLEKLGQGSRFYVSFDHQK